MSVTKYDQLTIDKVIESEVRKGCFYEPFQLSANFPSHKVSLENQAGYKAIGRDCVDLLIDPIRFGWNYKSLRINNIVLLFIANTMFRINQQREQDPNRRRIREDLLLAVQ